MQVDNATFQERMARFHEVCRGRGLRITAQRLEVFSALARCTDHPSAETLYRRVHKRVPGITLDTVYRTMEKLEEVGLVLRVSVVGNRMRFEANLDRHHHFVCRGCGVILDVYSAELDQLRLPEKLSAGYVVERSQVELRGVCPRCAEASGQVKG